MRYCKKCVQPDTRPEIYFNEQGVCGACLYEEQKKHIDWERREEKLHEIVRLAKKNKKNVYDCVIGVSGGKDSTFQALYSRNKLGLRPLLVNCEPENITEIGKRNIENLKQLGFDVISIRPNPVVMKKLVRKSFYKFGNPVKITEYPLYASAHIIAYTFRIPLIIQGENTAFTLGVRDLNLDGNALHIDRCNTFRTSLNDFLGDGITDEDLFLFHYDKQKMIDEGFRGVWLQYYTKEWSQPHNCKFAVTHGLTVRPEDFDPYEFGTYAPFFSLDSDLVQVNQMLKYVKFGFGQCTDHACYDIRDGHLTREEAIGLVRKYDGKCDIRYIKQFCDYLEITVDEFWRVANSFRGSMWKKDEKGEWVLKDPIWEQEEKKKKILV